MSNSAPETMVRIGLETFPALYDLVVMTFLQVFGNYIGCFSLHLYRPNIYSITIICKSTDNEYIPFFLNSPSRASLTKAVYSKD